MPRLTIEMPDELRTTIDATSGTTAEKPGAESDARRENVRTEREVTPPWIVRWHRTWADGWRR